MKIKPWVLFLMIAAPIFLASCGSSTAPTTYTIGGNISGLSGSGLVLQYNGANNLSASSSGPFIFVNPIVAAATYNVTILTQPSNPAQTCTVTSGGSGTANSDIVIVEIACANNTFTVGGSVSGLAGTGLVLQYNGANNLTISANGSFTFATSAQRGSNYTVTILTQPTAPAQTCDVSNGVGTNINGNITAVQVTCYNTTVTYTIGGSVSGLAGAGLVLQNNSGDNLAVSGNGSFTFATPVASGANYSVTVLAQPTAPLQTCVVAGGGGTATANVTGIQVICSTTKFAIGGTISGLTGAGLVLQDNGGDNLAVSAGATSFAFATPVASGAAYAVTVLTQPTGQTCAITGGSGTVGNAGVTSVSVTCGGTSFNISATVSGLPANTSVVLQDNGGDNLTITTNGITTDFNTPVATGAAYAVTVLTQPAGATCTPGAGASGNIASANVNVAVTCADPPIAAGAAHVCAITSAGGVVCWGANDFGQLGNGTTTDSARPVQVVGLTGVVSVTAGYDSTCALTGSGAIWCWGDNSSGQLGNGTYAPSSVPVQVVGATGDEALGGVTAISAGRDHACAVTGNGAAFCWGDNSEGELGTGNFSGSSVPVPVAGLASGVASISAGSYFTCAVTTAGAASCWGQGSSGQLRSGSLANSDIPVAVVDAAGKIPLTGVAAVSAGPDNACALMSSGAALCWGANSSGLLGNGSAGPSAIVAIAAGPENACAVTGAGAALCTGQNATAQAGDGGGADSANFALIPWLPSGVTAIAAGGQQTCALTTARTVVCWGFGPDGQLNPKISATYSIP